MDSKLGASDGLPVGGWRRGQSGGRSLATTAALFTVKDQIRFERQSSEDAWKTQLAGGENVQVRRSQKNASVPRRLPERTQQLIS
jgi:hypothetical protein